MSYYMIIQYSPHPKSFTTLWLSFFFLNCLCNLVYEHLFALTVKHFLLCNNLLFIGGVCQHLAGRNHGDGSWCASPACVCYPVISWSSVLKPAVTLQHATLTSPVHHQPLTYCKVTHTHTYTHVDMHASRLNTRVGYILQCTLICAPSTDL